MNIVTPTGEVLSHLTAGDVFGERGLLRNAPAPNSGRRDRGQRPSTCCRRQAFCRLLREHPEFRGYFNPDGSPAAADRRQVPVLHAARRPDVGQTRRGVAGNIRTGCRKHVRRTTISCLPVMRDDRLAGIVTTRDFAKRIVAEGASGDTPVGEIMTPEPVTRVHPTRWPTTPCWRWWSTASDTCR